MGSRRVFCTFKTGPPGSWSYTAPMGGGLTRRHAGMPLIDGWKCPPSWGVKKKSQAQIHVVLGYDMIGYDDMILDMM